MTMGGKTIFDTDAHYVETLYDIVDYIDDDDPWKLKFEYGSTAKRSVPISFWPSLSRPDGFNYPSIKRRDVDFNTKEGVVQLMEEMSFDKILLLSEQILTFAMLEEDKRQTKFAEAYIQYMLDKIADADEGMYMSIPVPYNDPVKAAELIDEYADEKAVIGACVLTARIQPPMGHRKYDPIYDACQRADLPVLFHGGSATLDNFGWVSGFTTIMETHALGFLFDNMTTVANVVAQGVPEKFPKLNFVFQETGLFWIPMMMYRMDMEYLRMQDEAVLLRKRPSEYMKEFYYGTQPMEIVPDKKYLQYVIEMLGGPERLMYASDYPHEDFDDPSAITGLTFLTEEEKAGILAKNAEEVFGV